MKIMALSKLHVILCPDLHRVQRAAINGKLNAGRYSSYAQSEILFD